MAATTAQTVRTPRLVPATTPHCMLIHVILLVHADSPLRRIKYISKKWHHVQLVRNYKVFSEIPFCRKKLGYSFFTSEPIDYTTNNGLGVSPYTGLTPICCTPRYGGVPEELDGS